MSTVPEPISTEEAFHNGFYYFLCAVEVLSHDPERQCAEIGDYNVAWELKNDVMAGRYLLGTGFLPANEERCITNLLDSLKPVSVNEMPSGDGRGPNMQAMSNPVWVPLRTQARRVREELEAFSEVNRSYFQRGANAT